MNGYKTQFSVKSEKKIQHTEEIKQFAMAKKNVLVSLTIEDH